MYQFIHIESYGKVSAKKKLNYNKETKGRNVSEIIAEVTRKNGFCDHVEDPKEPVLLYGVNPSELEKLTDDYFNNTKLINNKGIERGLRKDSHILLAGVISINREVEEIWDDYKNSSIEWLKNKYGDKLKCVVEHLDESQPHLHFYCIEENGKDFNLLHEGKKAFSLETQKYKKEIAFKEAMRKFQEDFFNNVSLKYGLMKTGPKRRRLTNKEYKQQQQEVRLINLFKNKTEDEVNLLISNTERYIESQKKKAESEILSFKNTATATGLRIGKSIGYKDAIKDFADKNYMNKVIFSKSFSEKIIMALEEKNKNLIDKNKKMFSRKEHYKKISEINNDYKIKYEHEKKKSDYVDIINDFINKPKLKEENLNDIRAGIITEIKRIETQQQQLNKGLEYTKSRSDLNISKVNGIGEKLGRVTRILFGNVRSFVGDFFEFKLFERIFKKEKNDTIKKIEHKKEDLTIKNNRRSTDKRTIKKI